ncbi:MAG: hypothetical protein F6K24_52430 [Okeania sp. SIO2D1]|nr:hypothetical protein [Okeania sp. SIO2D1]
MKGGLPLTKRCDPATTPARLRNAHQEKKRIYDLKTGIEAIPIRLLTRFS